MAIYADNDGLGAIFEIVSGFFGATLVTRESVLRAILAGLVASELASAEIRYGNLHRELRLRLKARRSGTV